MGSRKMDRARIAREVRAGATDTSIMDRYELSKEELYSFYDDLVKEGRLAISDLLGDLPPAPEPGLMLVEECPVCGTHNLVDTERCASCGSTLPRRTRRSSGGEPPPEAPEPIKVTVHVPDEPPGDEVTDFNRGGAGTTGEQVAVVEEDATVDLDTVLDDFAGLGSGVRDVTGTADSAWAVTTSGQDILEAIESIPSPPDTRTLGQEVDADELTDSVTLQTELSLDEILDLASEVDATGDIAEEAQQLDLDFDFDRTIALVHRENLLRKKRDTPRLNEGVSDETEITVDGLITLSSEIEIPESRETTTPPPGEDSALVFASREISPPEDSEDDRVRETGDGRETGAESAAVNADLKVVETEYRQDVATTVAEASTTGQPVPYYEPTVRLDPASGFHFGENDAGITSEDILPDDDVDLDFTLVSDLKAGPSAESILGSEEEPPPDAGAVPRLKSEFTFNLDDLDDEQPESVDEHVALSFEGKAEEQEARPSDEEIPQVPVLRTVRDTQLLETQAHSQLEEDFSIYTEEPQAAKPREKSGPVRFIVAASVLLILLGLGGLGLYTGFVTIPDGMLSDLPLISNGEQAKLSVDRGRQKPPPNKAAPPVKQEAAQAEHVAAQPVQSPTAKGSPGSTEQMASLPSESPTRGTPEIPSPVGKSAPRSPAAGKRRAPGLTPTSATASELVEAVRGNDAERVMRLLDSGSDVNGKDAAGATPLMTAVEQGNESLVVLLLKRGANSNSKDRNGDTPLMVAAGKGRVSVVKALLNGGADSREVNNEGRTVLAQVHASGPTLFVSVHACREIVRLIREHEERQAFAIGR